MSKRPTLMDFTQPSTSKQLKPPSSTNWEICAFCQVSQVNLCNVHSDQQSSLLVVGMHLWLKTSFNFETLNHMPRNINLERLDDGDGIESTLKAHRAGWHKKCRLQFNKKAFYEQKQRELTEGQQQSTPTPMPTRTYLLLL